MESTKNQWYMEVSDTKVTRILPRKLAIGWQEFDLVKTDSKLEYYRGMTRVLEKMSEEGHDELRHLKGGTEN